MNTSEIKQAFTASDGQNFDTIEEAVRHNEFIDAEEGFNAAWKKLKKLAINQYKTADGYDFGDGAGYWWKERCFLITGRYNSLYPSMLEIQLYPSNIISITVEEDSIKIHAEIYFGGSGRTEKFYLSDLYKKEENAKKELIKILQENIETCQTQINELQK